MAYPGQGGHHYQQMHGGGGGYGQQGGYGYGPPSGPPPQQMGGYGYGGGGGGFAPPSHPPPGGVQGQMGYGYAPQSGPIGPPEYATNNVNFNPQGGMMGNTRYEYSSMQGKRKALLIGINYFGQNGELRGCINDVRNVQNFLRQRGYNDDDMVVLTDDQRDARSIPTRQNMTAAMHWLVRGAQPGDALFFHYSGHGGQAKASQGDEADGYNETIIPVDYQQVGQMEDDELHAILVRPLPVGCRLTAIFDSCHSGTALDLPYVYTTSGNVKEPNVMASVGKGIMGAAMEYARGDVIGMAKGLFSTFNTAKNTNGAEEVTKQTRSSGADVVMLSGCKDSQTSADATEAGKATGACSFAFLSVMNQYPQLTYKQMLNAVRDVLASKYSQKPQLSSSHPIDMNLLFVV
ncbi:probable MCA1-Metacaspase [Sporisorium reilianum f. sp. reilianum]|uniref:Probable MCA1-Metacaspase n=1 Tax=Sporisorium reilianum f. sp. reilianum TaxID=72559 RepID=A0A2N8U9N0_9BASI|nr:probable MCA1-Metacaspase [Sporisorium reilianum f. sp. reilianum]